MMKQKRNEKGAVSLFVVIFAALLIITIATAFIRIMVQDQMQATSNDLSKSALDSAYAGVEDAKRAIVEYYRPLPAEPDPAVGSVKPDCSTVRDGVNQRCDVLRRKLFQANITPANDGWTDGCDATAIDRIATLTNGTKGEVRVKTNTADNDLNQAYTCIKVQMNPQEIIGTLSPDTSKVIQLKSKDGEAFTKIKVQWYIHNNKPLDLDSNVPYQLPDAWPANRPAVVRAQLLQYRSSFHLGDFDGAGLNKNNLTLFLLPSLAGLNTASFSDDVRQQQTTGAATPVSCSSSSATNPKYACEETISLPCAGGDCDDYPQKNSDRTAYLRLSQFYNPNNSAFRLTMYDKDDKPVRFGDVQAVVDSTGRANDIFRRIRSYVDLGASTVPNAEAAVDVTKSLCKDFAVTNDTWMKGNAACPNLPN